MSTDLKNIKDRLEADKSEYTFGAAYDQSIRDREYLLAIVEDQGKILKALTLPLQLFVSNTPEQELNRALAADKAEEDPALEAKTKWAKENFGAVYRGTERIK